jgi:hypothetical protein
MFARFLNWAEVKCRVEILLFGSPSGFVCNRCMSSIQLGFYGFSSDSEALHCGKDDI